MIGKTEFKRLAREDPLQLLALVQGGTLRVSDLTYAAEALGDIKTDHTIAAVLVLLRVTENPGPLVREGAILGLAESPLRHRDDVGQHLSLLAKSDDSRGVRETVGEALETIAECVEECTKANGPGFPWGRCYRTGAASAAPA